MKTSIVIGLILGALVLGAGLTASYNYQQDQKETREDAIFYNGTVEGKIQLVEQMQLNKFIPLFNQTGQVNYYSWDNLCDNLEIQK